MKFDAFGTAKHGKGKSLWKKTFLLYLSVHWGDLIEQIKQILSYREVHRNEKQMITNQVSLEIKEKFEHHSSLFNPLSLFLTLSKGITLLLRNMVFRVNALKSVA